MLALGSADHSVSLWETQTGIRRTTFKTDSTVSSLSLSPDGRVLAFGGPEEPARVLRIAPASEDQFPKPVAQQHYVPDLYPASIALSPDTRNVAQLDQLSIDHTQVLHAWDTATGKAIIPIQKATNVHFSHSFFAPDNRQLANTDDLWQVNDTFRVVDITTGKIKFWPRGPWGETFTAAFSPDNALLATGHNDVIRIWDIKADRQIRSLPYRGRAVRTLAFSPDARCIAVGGSGNSLDVFDVRSGKSVVTLQKKSDDRKQFVNALAFSRDGLVLATSNSGPPPSVQLWHCSPGATYQQMIPEVLHGNVGTVLALAVSPDGCTLATGGTSQMIHVWNTATGRETIRLPYRGNQVQCLAFAIDQRSLVAVDQSGQLYRWCISASK